MHGMLCIPALILLHMICKWYQQFTGGWESMNGSHAGCPIEVHTDKNRYRVEKFILRDYWVIVTELEAATELVRCQIHQSIQAHSFRKICGR